MSKIDAEKFRRALRQMDLEAAVDRESEEEGLRSVASSSADVEERLMRIAASERPRPTQEPDSAGSPPTPIRRAMPAVRGAQAWMRTHRWFTFSAPLVAAAAVLAIVMLKDRLHPGVTPSDTTYAIVERRSALPTEANHVVLGSNGQPGEEVRGLRKHRSEQLSLELKPRSAQRIFNNVHVFISQPGRAARLWEYQPIKAAPGAFILNVPLREASELEAEQDLFFVFGASPDAPDPGVLKKVPGSKSHEIDSLHLTLLD
jgi:hypothetical protein